MTETALLQRLMLHWSSAGMRLFRNNCGQLRDERGGYVRYGVANPGGSDLIGWVPVIVTEAMVGKPLAVFCAVEGKVGRNQPTTEQSRFIAAVRQAGGLGVIARDVVSEVETELKRLTGL